MRREREVLRMAPDLGSRFPGFDWLFAIGACSKASPLRSAPLKGEKTPSIMREGA